MGLYKAGQNRTLPQAKRQTAFEDYHPQKIAPYVSRP
jgi:hypothetical protein